MKREPRDPASRNSSSVTVGFSLMLAAAGCNEPQAQLYGTSSALTSSDEVEAAHTDRGGNSNPRTTTPIEHLVVLFQENVPFDRYFGAYPHALNPAGEPPFSARPDTPTVNGLTEALLTANPNSANPHRLDRTQQNICGSNHGYTAEQHAYDHGLVDQFVEFTGNHGAGCDPTLGLGYFDGNTVTALWNYAQHFAMNDNSFNTTFGPSTPGVLNLVASEPGGAMCGPISAVTVVAPCSNVPSTSTPSTRGGAAGARAPAT